MNCVKYEDFNLICRLCLRQVGALTRFGDLPKNKNLSFIETILEFHLKFKISIIDRKPQNICKACILHLFKTCHFLQMCIKSNNLLDEALKQENIAETEPVDEAVNDPLNINQENFPKEAINHTEVGSGAFGLQIKDFGFSREHAFSSNKLTEDNETCTIPFVKIETSINQNEWNSGDLFEVVKNDVSCFDADDSVAIKIEDDDEPSDLPSANVFEQQDLIDKTNTPSFTNSIDNKSRNIKKNVKSQKRPLKTLQSSVKKKSVDILNNDEIEDTSYEFKCQICMETLSKFSEVIDHFDKKHDGCRKCILCEKYYSHKPPKVIKYHMSKHRRKQSRFDCQKCVMFFLTKQEMTQHFASEEHNADPRVCNVCKKKFRNHSTMLNHMGLHTNEKKFTCTACGQAFTHKGSLCRHISTTHDGFKVLCSQCGKAFTTKVALDIHTQVVHQGDKTPYLEQYARLKKMKMNRELHPDLEPDVKETKCRYCDEEFYSVFKRKQHESLKHQMTHDYRCRLCVQVFPNPKARNTHIHTVHHKFKCAQCFRGFSTQEKLNSHMELHNRRGSNTKCPVCGLECRFKANVEKHMRTHTGATPYVCDKCGKRFRQAINLKYHQFKHTQKRPYSCHLCSKVFTQKNFLDSHLNVHAGKYPYPCKLCEKQYPSQRALTKHLKRVHNEVNSEAAVEAKGEKAFVCEFCGRDYAVKGNLAKHVRKVHKEGEPAVSTPVSHCDSSANEDNGNINKHQYSY